LGFTEAILELALLQATDFLVALVGQTVTLGKNEYPIFNVLLEGVSSIEVTRMSPVTTTVHDALFPLPSAAVAVIFAEPLDTAVTTPPLTVATLLLELVQFTFLFVTLSGQTVA
jgi:hypothetical protein